MRRDPATFKACVVIVLGLAGILAGSATANRPPSFGDPLPGLTVEELNGFFAGKDEFEQVETVATGLGPVFNDTSCAACHASPAVGGDSEIVETRFGTLTDHRFDPLTPLGGSLVQSQGIGQIASCDYAGEVVPVEATIVVHRKTQPLFGLGLVDNVPDAGFHRIAAHQRRVAPSTAGRAHMVKDVTTGRVAVGRFGHKAQVPSLRHFAADAYLNEMGITNPFFPDENCPQGDCALLACDPLPDPEDAGADVEAFTRFMTLLGPPPRGPITPPVQAGAEVFDNLGCAVCHVPTLKTGPHSIAALDHVTFQPFSDFLLHDMGSLGDGIEQGRASGREMRTAPLWGLRARTRFLHDGRATTVEGAILAHEGQGATARNRFAALHSRDRRHLLAFLSSL